MATISPNLATALLLALVLAVGTAESSRPAGTPDDVYPMPTVMSEHNWLPVRGFLLKKKHVLDAARFAVTTYNNEHPGELPLKLVRVDGGEVLAAGAGVVYHLYLTASSHAHSEEKYQTFVFVPLAGEMPRQLLFAPVDVVY
ncbi:unnamed protein product [Linum tenue]|uniref:Cysteine proteinase inhibitor n=1 Tax=Linum tenue TaxID=586396 RepID=A0AAV0GNY7_9ROSI|nr:unnamed protein product [Linum tenue]